MKRATLLTVAMLCAATVGIPSPAAGQQGDDPPDDPQGTEGTAGEPADREMYTATVSPDEASDLAAEDVDIADTRRSGDQVEIDAVLTAAERRRLHERTGVDMRPAVNAEGYTASEFAELQAESGYEVWRSWDEPGGIADEIDQVASENPFLVKRVTLGQTHQGREVVALKVGLGARILPDGIRPSVLHTSAQHAREWISVEVNRRLLHWMLDEFHAGNREVQRLLATTETWFVLVANPDGYQHTFDHDRLWRKNLRDNDGDGQVSGADGVDLNRNFDSHWGYDEEGSSSSLSSQTYRGPSPASEPETVAVQDLMQRIRPEMVSNWHSFGSWLLYPQGWQVGTLDADNPVYVALTGTDADPAIPGFDPGPSADELYATNGETTDYASELGAVAITPELGEGIAGAGFVYPDDEELVEAEFRNSLDYALGLSRSAWDPARPESPVGIETEPFYLSQADIDPENGSLSMFDFRFDVSHGDPQEVRVLARDDLRNVRARYRIDGGRTRSARTSTWDGGDRYGSGGGNHYEVRSAQVRGARPGDTVEVWFTAGRHRSESFSYTVASDTGNDVLVLASEDYTGSAPAHPDPSGPAYLGHHRDALEASGIDHDVYDFDARDRTAAHPLGVLSHYEAVVWYTGDDIVTREPGWAAGNASRQAVTQLYAVRDFMNEGGRVVHSGKWAGQQFTTGVGSQLYDPFENAECRADPDVLDRCRALHGSGNLHNDVIEYWFGAGIVNVDGGTDPSTGAPFDVAGVDEPLAGQTWGFNGADSAGNQDHSGSFITTSGLLPEEDFPQFESWVSAEYDRPGGPFDPHGGDHYVYSNLGDVSYKRLTATLAVPGDGATLSFWTSRATEPDWDHFFVEARTPGQDDWTTLPDQEGHTSQSPGQSCPAGWRDLHPHLDHYQTLDPAGPSCEPVGTTGEWHAASGGSDGWEQWSVDLSAYAGGEVEISLAYASDWATQGLGVFIDDVEVSTGAGSTGFEEDLGGWEVTGPPEGSAPNPNDFERITGAGFPEGAVVSTADSVLMGFGLEGVTGADTRADLADRVVAYLRR